MRWTMLWIVLGLGALIATSGAWAADAGAGQALYAKKCTACHGPTGSGNERLAKSLKKDLNLLREGVASKDDAFLTKFITEGRLPMPAFGKTLSKTEIADVVAYVRKLQGKK